MAGSIDSLAVVEHLSRITSGRDLSSILHDVPELGAYIFAANRAVVLFVPADSAKKTIALEWSDLESNSPEHSVLELLQYGVEQARADRAPVVLREFAQEPLAARQAELDGATLAVVRVEEANFELFLAVFVAPDQAINDQQLQLAQHALSIIAPRLETPEAATDVRYRRLVEHSDALIFHADSEHRITFISRRALDFFGVSPEDFLKEAPVYWYELVHIDDRERVRQAALEAGSASYDEEFRVVNHVTGRKRWLLTKLVPIRDQNGSLSGWDGFGIDITARKDAQHALDAQSKKVRALYTVSTAIRGFLDPSNIASRGLAALCDATGAEAAICYLYPTKQSDKLNLIAHHGFSAGVAERLGSESPLAAMSLFVAQQGQSVVIPDVRNDPRTQRLAIDDEGIRSALLVPVSVEEDTLGTLGLFNRSISAFDGGDVMLVAAAANQIGLAARQANLFSAYRRQTKNLAALYRLTHELSGYLTLDEIFQKAFEVLRDELGLKRLWLGMLNETGTRVIGQAAYGPGWKRRLVEVNIEIAGPGNPIGEVIAKRKPLVIDDAEMLMNEFGIRRFFARLGINSVGLVPLLSGGQVLGVLAFQPGSSEGRLDEEELQLLSSLASEIAASALARRLEERVGEAEKMRSTGLLAAGIAHNFNNLLQAILGQASLLEMQASSTPAVEKAAGIITDSATKGASLVRQLMSFANLEEPRPEVCDVNAVVERGQRSLERELLSSQQLRIELESDLKPARVDPRQLLRILSALVQNAKEAMDERGEVQVFTETVVIDRNSPHYEVPFGEYVRIGVRDNGIGMDPEQKRRCFEPFFTTKDVDPNSGLSLSGAGLGLAAAYALARKNGGRLVVDSRKGHGSLFTLYVPVATRSLQSKEQELLPPIEVERIAPVSAVAEQPTVTETKPNGRAAKGKP